MLHYCTMRRLRKQEELKARVDKIRHEHMRSKLFKAVKFSCSISQY